MFASGQMLQTLPLSYEQNDGHIKNTWVDFWSVSTIVTLKWQSSSVRLLLTTKYFIHPGFCAPRVCIPSDCLVFSVFLGSDFWAGESLFDFGIFSIFPISCWWGRKHRITTLSFPGSPLTNANIYTSYRKYIYSLIKKCAYSGVILSSWWNRTQLFPSLHFLDCW